MYNKNNKEYILHTSLHRKEVCNIFSRYKFKKIYYENQIKRVVDISILLPINIHKNVKRL